ncbi:MAG: glycerol-3-phosphate O-acyltransferase [Phenylobacterium sp.]|jgi:glycerol-3-phosphate O-acyltransferase
MKIGNTLYNLMKFPLSFFMKSKIVPDNVIDDLEIDPARPIFYIIKTNSLFDKIAIGRACKNAGLPSPNKPVMINEHSFTALLCLENLTPILFGQARKTDALTVGASIVTEHHQNRKLDAQLIPITIAYGRAPGKEKADLHSIIADSESPSSLRKLFMVLFSGRNNYIRFSQPVSLRFMADKHGTTEGAGHKLLRVARFHFYRQKLAATGPRLWNRQQMSNSILSAPLVQQAMAHEVATSDKDKLTVKKDTQKLLDELAADYRESYIRVANRFMSWLWNKLYSGIEVNNAKQVRELAEKGHEIIYVPCHRSHMDYLLLSYVIHNEGLVPPHIAAGINLNFGPVGPVLRRGGAFFLRRSFKGEKLYTAVFNEYIGQLFKKGYSVEYFIEGGRSRTGRLLDPKTGMLAMTIQAMLRGIDRPVTFVPVYIGYEHVMEVTTYLKELKGSSKKSESVFGVIKALRNLRNYGYGYVNFGQPLPLKEFLTNQVPDWKQDIHATQASKPAWLPEATNLLAKQIMTSINSATALSATTLSATTLLAANKNTLPRSELEAQLDVYLKLHRQVRYTDKITTPDTTGEAMVSHLITLKKVAVTSDSYGELISLDEKQSVLMTYYRNNTIHLFAVPSLIAGQVLRFERISPQQVISVVEHLYPLFKDEWFLDQRDVAAYAQSVIDALIEQRLISMADGEYLVIDRQSPESARLQLLANIIDNTLARYAIVLNLLSHKQQIARNELEEKSQVIGQRLSSIYGIKSPEFFDQKVLSSLVSSLTRHGHMLTSENDQQQLKAGPSLEDLTATVTAALDNDVVQSITQVIR